MPSDNRFSSELTRKISREIEIAGPDDARLVIHPAANHFRVSVIPQSAIYPVTDCYLWKIHNGALHSFRELRLQLTSSQSFDEKKSAFRESIDGAFRWSAIKDLGAGASTNAEEFLSVDGDQVRLWNNEAPRALPWPNGDHSPIRCWRLAMTVIGLIKRVVVPLGLEMDRGKGMFGNC